MPDPRPRLALALVLALAAAACGGSLPSSRASTEPGTPGSTPVSATEPPSGTGSPPESGEPVESEEGPTEEPVETEAPATGDPDGSAEPTASPEASAGPAASCSGSDDNRDFFDRVAAAVDWSVLCAVLPKGWYVSAGSYRLANGGKLVIGYKGPRGATLALSEGAFCADDSGCVPAGTDGGDVPLGPLTGTLVRLDDGGFAVVADRGRNPSWLLEAQGLDEATTRALAAALHLVEG